MIDKAARNRQNAKSRNNYNAKTYDNITFRVKLDGSDGVTRDAIKAAAERDKCPSVIAWIIEAIRDKL